MPEGHTLFRLARDVSDRFAGRVVSVTSPQGRFADSAALVDRTELVGSESWGKHLFIEFENCRYVHVHLGLYGRFDLHDGSPGPPVGQVRMRVVAGSDGSSERPSYGDLRGATVCELLTAEQRNLILARLGPDPLRGDADWTRAWQRVSVSKAPIGGLLMDQAVLSGVGNVYRAEVLFRHRLHPLRPGNTLRRRQVESIWQDLVMLMQEGVRTGRIDTVHTQHTPQAMGRGPRIDDHGGEVYVYRRQGRPCYVCGGLVRTELLGGRNVFWCPRCQPRFRSRARGS